MNKVHIAHARLTRAMLRGADIALSTMIDAEMAGTDLSRANLKESNLSGPISAGVISQPPLSTARALSELASGSPPMPATSFRSSTPYSATLECATITYDQLTAGAMPVGAARVRRRPATVGEPALAE
jgi:uncharacterized protein YjbI with pentapeptide repeats